MVKKVGDMELYTVKELAKLLDFQETTVRKMLREGTFKGKKLGKKWFITDKAIQDYFMEGKKNNQDKNLKALWQYLEENDMTWIDLIKELESEEE